MKSMLSRKRRILKKVPSKPNSAVKSKLSKKADEFIESVLKPLYVEEKPEDKEHVDHYITDIFSRWHGRFLYFRARYRYPRAKQDPQIIREYVTSGFARLEHVNENCFNLAYKRPTGRFWQLYQNLSFEECKTVMLEDPHFKPV